MKIVLVTRSFVVDEGKRSLLIKRVSTDRHNPGLWECPGGKVEEQDLWISRMREVAEETGLLAEPSSPLSYIYSEIIGKGKHKGSLCVCIFSVMRAIGGEEIRLKKDEHNGFAWLSYDEMLSYDLTPETRRAAVVLREYLI